MVHNILFLYALPLNCNCMFLAYSGHTILRLANYSSKSHQCLSYSQLQRDIMCCRTLALYFKWRCCIVIMYFLWKEITKWFTLQKNRKCLHYSQSCLTAGVKLGDSYWLPVASGTVTAITRENYLQSVCWWEENNESSNYLNSLKAMGCALSANGFLGASNNNEGVRDNIVAQKWSLELV